MERNVIKSRTYAVSCANACTVKTADGVLLCSVSAGVQSQFVAVTDSVVISDDSAICELSFNSAPASSASGGGSASSSAMLEYSSYIVTANTSTLVLVLDPQSVQEFDLSAISELTVQSISIEGASDSSVATAEFWLRTGETAPSIVWPEAAIWLGSVAEGSAPTLEASTRYCFAVRQNADGQLMMNLAYSYASAT